MLQCLKFSVYVFRCDKKFPRIHISSTNIEAKRPWVFPGFKEPPSQQNRLILAYEILHVLAVPDNQAGLSTPHVLKFTFNKLFEVGTVLNFTGRGRWGQKFLIHLPKITNQLSTGTRFSIHSTLDPRTFLVAHTVKHLPTMRADLASIPGSGRFSGEGNGNPLQYSYL